MELQKFRPSSVSVDGTIISRFHQNFIQLLLPYFLSILMFPALSHMHFQIDIWGEKERVNVTRWIIVGGWR